MPGIKVFLKDSKIDTEVNYILMIYLNPLEGVSRVIAPYSYRISFDILSKAAECVNAVLEIYGKTGTIDLMSDFSMHVKVDMEPAKTSDELLASREMVGNLKKMLLSQGLSFDVRW